MTEAALGFTKRLRLAGMLLIAGLIVEGVCLLWVRPVTFILLVCGGGWLCAAGIVVYLSSLVSAGEAEPEP